MALSPWQLCFHANMKCHVRTCNNKKIITNTVFSPYCKHHVCTVCLKQKTGFKRGYGEERVCRHHSCAHPSCHAPRSKKHPTSTYCARHACNVRTCDQPRHGPGLFCRRHTCRGRGCLNCVHPPSPAPLHSPTPSPSPFPPSSPDPALLDPVPAQADHNHHNHHQNHHSYYYYCPGHQPCRASRCASLAFRDPSHRAAKYCFRHHCAASASCASQRVDSPPSPPSPSSSANANANTDAVACRDHTCALYPSCADARADVERGLFCEGHECAEPGCRKQRYETGGSSNTSNSNTGYTGLLSAGVRRGGAGVGEMGGVGRGRGGVWCADHMCMAALTRQDECANRREGTPTNPLYCADHELCEEVGCVAFRAVRGRGVRLARCEEHLKSKCAFPSCLLDAEGNAAACRYHVCRADGCLTMLSQTITATSPRTSLFCDVHRCVESECVNPRLTTTTTTTSATTPAVAVAVPPSGVGEGGNVYCAEHVHQRRMGLGPGLGLGLGLGFGPGLCARHGGRCRHAFGARYRGMCCRFRGGGSGDDDDDDDSDDDDDDTITDHGGSSSAGAGLDISPCFCCGGAGDCRSHGKKCNKCVKC